MRMATQHTLLRVLSGMSLIAFSLSCSKQSVKSKDERLLTDRNSYIKNGKDAIPHSIPYQVGITQACCRDIFCGGTLISTKFVLTAAHCTYKYGVKLDPIDIRVVVGEHDFIAVGDEQARKEIADIVRHPDYNHSVSWEFDVALIMLEFPVTITEKVKIIHLATDPNMNFTEKSLFISGWGLTEEKKFSNVLKETEVSGLPHSKCIAAWKNVSENLFCAGHPNRKVSTCSGDSGGPVTSVRLDGNKHLVGVIIGGSRNCDSLKPQIFFNVAKHLAWIMEKSDAFEGQQILYNDSQRQDYKGNTKNEVPWGYGIMNYKDGSKYEGEWFNGSPEGYGTFYFSKEDPNERYKYEGLWQNHQQNGRGILMWKDVARYEGDFLNGSRHGKGKIVYSNESPSLSYEGDWVEDKYSGKGVYIWKDGKKYEGDFLNDLKHGKGKHVFSNESRYLSYEGDWVEDKSSGKGVFIWKSGAKYEGDFLNGLSHGKGKLVFSKESPSLSYEGDLVEDKKSGKGVFIWKSGSKYEGDWLNGLFHGKGKFVFSKESSALSYEGDWVEDKKSGQGILIWKSGAKYEGGWLNDLKHGKGKLVFSNEDPSLSYEGDWVEDKKSGKGVLIWKSGAKYEGDFLNGLSHGKGKHVYSNESPSLSYEGDWVEDKWSGKGVYIWKDGSKYEGDFLNDSSHGKGIQTSASGQVLQQGEWENGKFKG